MECPHRELVGGGLVMEVNAVLRKMAKGRGGGTSRVYEVLLIQIIIYNIDLLVIIY